jgi:hypothetical protein
LRRRRLVEAKAIGQSRDLLVDGEESRVDDDMRSIPAFVMALDDSLPCRQLVALHIGCSGFDATTMLYRVGADDFDLAHANAGATGDVQPDIARRLYWITCSIVSSRTCTAPIAAPVRARQSSCPCQAGRQTR